VGFALIPFRPPEGLFGSPKALLPQRVALADDFSDTSPSAQSLIQLAHEEQATIGGDPRALEFDAEPGVE